MSYMTIFSQEKQDFSLCSCFHAHPTLLLKILGGPMHGRSPTSNFGGTVPPVPPRAPPLLFLFKSNYFRTYFLYIILRYNNISRPVHDSNDPPATLPATPAQNLGVATLSHFFPEKVGFSPGKVGFFQGW